MRYFFMMVVLAAVSLSLAMPSHAKSSHHSHSNHGDDDTNHSGHSSPTKTHAISKECKNIPTAQLFIQEDTHAGWNLYVNVKHFTFTPHRTNQESYKKSCTFSGHAHLYVNGKKVTRIYGAWHYIPTLPKGKVTIRVELNDDLHKLFTYRGKPVMAETKIRN